MSRSTCIPFLLLLAIGIQAQVPGSLDPGFGTGGVAFVEPGADAGVIAMAEDATGRIISVIYSSTFSSYPVLQRHSAAGVLDGSFGSGGSYVLPDSLNPRLIAVQPDGRVVLAGNVGNAPDPTFVARVLPDGGMDPSFSGDGVATFSLFTEINFFEDVELAPNGAILLGGSGYDGTGPRRGWVMRLLPDGSLDPAFGVGGSTTFNIASETYVYDIEILGNGAIALGGRVRWEFAAPDLMVGRLLPDGTVDASYGTAGFTVLPYSTTGDGTDDYISMTAWPDGTVAIAGATELDLGNIWMSGLVIGKLDATGTLDPGFGSGGWQLFDLDSVAIYFTHIEAWSDSSLLVDLLYAHGGFTDWTTHGMVIHVSAYGVPDAGFGTDGVLDLEFLGAEQQELPSMIITADQGILLGGSRYASLITPSEALLVKLHGPAVGITEGRLSNMFLDFGGLLIPTDNLLRITDLHGRPFLLELLDLHGRKVAVLHNGCADPSGLVRFDLPTALGHGSYVLQAIVAGQRFVRVCVY